MQGSEIAPPRRPSTSLRTGSGRGVNEFLIKRFSELGVENLRGARKFFGHQYRLKMGIFPGSSR